MKSIYTYVLIAIMGVSLFTMGCEPSLIGDWESACAAPVAPGIYSSEVDVTFTDDARDITVRYYFEGDGTCNTLLYTVDTATTYTVGDVITNAQMEEVTEIDYTDYVVLLTPEALSVPSMNVPPGECGITDWVAGVPRDISGLVCAAGLTPDASTTLLEVFQLIDDSNLKLGLQGDGSITREEELNDRLYTPAL